MSRFGQELIQSAKEALAIARGTLEPAGKLDIKPTEQPSKKPSPTNTSGGPNL